MQQMMFKIEPYTHVRFVVRKASQRYLVVMESRANGTGAWKCEVTSKPICQYDHAVKTACDWCIRFTDKRLKS